MAKKPSQLPPEAADAVGGREESDFNKRNSDDSKGQQESGGGAKGPASKTESDD
jgi:hypothetical protein